jgi:hypothetical protein
MANRTCKLTRCDGSLDLALAEVKERVSQILEACLTRWAEPAQFGFTGPSKAAVLGNES